MKFTKANTKKLEKLIKYKPKTSLNIGIQKSKKSG